MLVTKIKKQNGLVDQPELDRIKQLLSFTSDGDYIVTIKRSESKRSIAQNKLFWLLINCLRNTFGFTANEMHDLVCKKFLSYKIESVNESGEVINTEVYKTTKDLKVKEFSELIDKLYALGAEFNITMPRPDEQWFDLFEEQFSQNL